MGMLRAWEWCPRCRAELAHSDGQVDCASCGFVFYANSQPTSSAVLRDEQGRILLVRRAIPPDEGKWDLPGGFLEEGEHPRAAVIRELREETGLEIEPLDLVAVEVDAYGEDEDAPSTLNLYWGARVVSGDPEPADDVSELRWFAPGELPPDGELAFQVNARLLARFRA
jgi:8-oxo-dGTP diphosphatase